MRKAFKNFTRASLLAESENSVCVCLNNLLHSVRTTDIKSAKMSGVIDYCLRKYPVNSKMVKSVSNWLSKAKAIRGSASPEDRMLNSLVKTETTRCLIIETSSFLVIMQRGDGMLISKYI